MCVYMCLPVLQHVWPGLQRPSVHRMSCISGPCQTNGYWQLSPGHVPWPLPVLPWLVEPWFLAPSMAPLSSDGSPFLTCLHSLYCSAELPPEQEEARPSLLQLINRGHRSLPSCLPSCTFSDATLCLRVHSTAPQGLRSVGTVLCLSWSLFCHYIIFWCSCHCSNTYRVTIRNSNKAVLLDFAETLTVQRKLWAWQ